MRWPQADALASATDDSPASAYRQYPAIGPSSMLFFEGLNARNLGRLIALYEHKCSRGSNLNINSFDQWGVELGKALAGKFFRGDSDGPGDIQPQHRKFLKMVGVNSQREIEQACSKRCSRKRSPAARRGREDDAGAAAASVSRCPSTARSS